MTQHEFAIVALLCAQAVTVALLCSVIRRGEWYRKAWIRESAELLDLKRGRN